MARRLNAESERHIKSWEGDSRGKPVLTIYRDIAGVPTGGWGHTGKDVPAVGSQITLSQANAWFRSDIAWAIRAVEKMVRVTTTDNQFGALVSWTLNIGETNAKTSTLIRKLNAGDYAAVPRELVKWNKITDPKTGKKVTSKGLVNRRAADAGLWVKGSHVASALNAPQAELMTPPVATRDVAAHAGTGALGVGASVGPAIPDIVDAVTSQQYELTSGDWVRIVIAVLIIAGVGYSLYRKFHDNDQ